MKNMKRILIMLLVLMVFAGCTSQADETQQADAGSGQQVIGDNAPEVQQGVSAEELAQHSLNTDCWVVYEGKVYDVTQYLAKHPGGADAISRFCGTNTFEDAFIGKHGTSKVELMIKETTLIGDLI